MEIEIGAEVVGADDTLGKVSRIVVDPHLGRVEDLVVKEGGLLGHEWVVPLSCIVEARPDRVELDLDEIGLQAMVEYDPAMFRAPDGNYVAPPATEGLGITPVEYQLDEALTTGRMGFIYTAPGGYPGSQGQVSDDRQLVVVEPGLDVFDTTGEKCGELGMCCIDTDTGRPTWIRVRRGLLFKNESEVPAEWIASVAPSGIGLNVDRERLAHLDQAA